jgi:hypothetical protein
VPLVVPTVWLSQPVITWLMPQAKQVAAAGWAAAVRVVTAAAAARGTS